ncbi:hypothetical protein BT63DRAFT_480999 [Microthyrium microscopicum]|uniref:Uncharacterized protein n=1 Tax=Microthyrium microscopicum TaxID=703497 RepID=A0A6A6U793_9PEZI|nr:hypothetical protein BT63DRAFT_480999 [Microthyrium microscopicum]
MSFLEVPTSQLPGNAGDALYRQHVDALGLALLHIKERDKNSFAIAGQLDELQKIIDTKKMEIPGLIERASMKEAAQAVLNTTLSDMDSVKQFLASLTNFGKALTRETEKYGADEIVRVLQECCPVKLYTQAEVDEILRQRIDSEAETYRNQIREVNKNMAAQASKHQTAIDIKDGVLNERNQRIDYNETQIRDKDEQIAQHLGTIGGLRGQLEQINRDLERASTANTVQGPLEQAVTDLNAAVASLNSTHTANLTAAITKLESLPVARQAYPAPQPGAKSAAIVPEAFNLSSLNSKFDEIVKLVGKLAQNNLGERPSLAEAFTTLQSRVLAIETTVKHADNELASVSGKVSTALEKFEMVVGPGKLTIASKVSSMVKNMNTIGGSSNNENLGRLVSKQKLPTDVTITTLDDKVQKLVDSLHNSAHPLTSESMHNLVTDVAKISTNIGTFGNPEESLAKELRLIKKAIGAPINDLTLAGWVQKLETSIPDAEALAKSLGELKLFKDMDDKVGWLQGNLSDSQNSVLVQIIEQAIGLKAEMKEKLQALQRDFDSIQQTSESDANTLVDQLQVSVNTTEAIQRAYIQLSKEMQISNQTNDDLHNTIVQMTRYLKLSSAPV